MKRHAIRKIDRLCSVLCWHCLLLFSSDTSSLNFFVSYAEGAVESIWSIDQYFEFVLVLMFSTGLSFQRIVSDTLALPALSLAGELVPHANVQTSFHELDFLFRNFGSPHLQCKPGEQQSPNFPPLAPRPAQPPHPVKAFLG
ncbi:hypothetical protein KSP39_PZI023424 [Platanthera zijinensis]|uniref:Uncharacterized protein n=1 Tax=Platanthera zijinensis TaxID=2320716 RepID=A0AAP0ATG4_9ASPA